MDLGKFTATFSTPMIDEPHETYIEYHLRELGVLTPTVRSGSWPCGNALVTGRGPAFYGCVVDATALVILAVSRLRVVLRHGPGGFRRHSHRRGGFPWGDYALIAAMSGAMPRIFMTRVRL